MGAFFAAGLKAWNNAALSGASGLTTLHVGWHTASPTAANEYKSNGIGRVAVGTLTSTNDTDSADLTNAAAITSAAATGATSALTHIGIWTAATGGSLIAHDELSAAVTLAIGEKVRLPAGELDITFQIA